MMDILDMEEDDTSWDEFDDLVAGYYDTGMMPMDAYVIYLAASCFGVEEAKV